MTPPRDHGGGLDAAIARYGGARSDWLDLSTGINPVAFPQPEMPADAWTALPDQGAMDALEAAARRFWSVPDEATVLAAPGASALIVNLPHLASPPGTVRIDTPTYNEYDAAFRGAGWNVADAGADARVVVSPNNPTGVYWSGADTHQVLMIDESFCDLSPEHSAIGLAGRKGTLILKSFGKFWGLAGLRLGFVIGDPALVNRLRDRLGPWPVSGPALAIGAAALSDPGWAEATRTRLRADAGRLDTLVIAKGAKLSGGTDLFRLYKVDNAARWQERLATAHVWSRIFPYSDNWLRLGLPAPDRWDQLEAAL